jgi:hypothetical protein
VTYSTSVRYGGANQSVDTTDELNTVWTLIENADDYDTRAALWGGLTAADSMRLAAFFPTSLRYGGSLDTAAERSAAAAEINA